MICKKCGKEIKKESTFCPHCGEKVKKSKFPKIIIVILVIALFVTVAALAATLLLKDYNNSTDKKTDNKAKVEDDSTYGEKDSKDDKDNSKKEDENDEMNNSPESSKIISKEEAMEIVLKIAGIKNLNNKEFNQELVMEYVDGNQNPVIKDDIVMGCMGAVADDFDSDGDNEILAVIYGDHSIFLRMYENKNGTWTESDSISMNDNNENYGRITSTIPHRADVFMKEVDGEKCIYIEEWASASFFYDGIYWSLEQLIYNENGFGRKNESLYIAGSSIGSYLNLKKVNEEDEDMDDVNDFVDKFYLRGLDGSKGLDYTTPLCEQNNNITYVAGYNQFHKIVYDEYLNWENNGYSGSLKGVYIDFKNEYDTTEFTKDDVNKTDEKDWKSAYKSYLSKLDLTSYDKYGTIYINYDDIPELVLYGNCEGVGIVVATYNNGCVNDVILERLGDNKYEEKGNRLYHTAGIMGSYYDEFYTIDNGEFKIKNMGTYENVLDSEGNAVMDSNDEFVQQYYCNNEKVSKKMYNKWIKDTIGDNMIDVTCQFNNSDELLSYLSVE